MLIEISYEMIYAMIALGGVAAGVLGFFYKRGRKDGIDESCAQRIEKKLDSVENKLNEEIKNTDASHLAMHGRIDKLADKVDDHAAKLHEKINIVNVELANIAGQFENHVKEKTD